VKLSPAIETLLCLHEIFRRLGFLANDLYVDTFADGKVQFALRHGGPTEEAVFRIDIWEDCTSVLKDWPEAVAWWNAPENLPAIAEIFKRSDARKRQVELIVALQLKGLIHDTSRVQGTA
jgi:hypothetical protein